MSSKTIELPEHIADSGEWRDWPRKAEAHVLWGVRQRQLEGYVRSGRVKVYACSDGSQRIEPDALREMFGEPGVVTDRNVSASERRRLQAEAASPPDPATMMFAKVVAMMAEQHEQSIGLLKVITVPMQQLLSAYQTANNALATRVEHLEKQADEAAVLRSELADAKQERDLSLRRHEASERRRDETLSLLKDQVPHLMKLYVEGDSLTGWAKRAPRDVVEAVVDSGTIAEGDADLLRRAAGIAPKPASNPNSNGVTDHGHS